MHHARAMNEASGALLREARKPPLRIVVMFHPDSECGRALAHDVFRRFMATAGSPGLRIPVAFLPEQDDACPGAWDADAAEHTLAVLLSDGRMARRARSEDRAVADAWAEMAVQLRIRLFGHKKHGVLLVAVDLGGLGLDATRLGEVSFVRLDRFIPGSTEQSDELAFQVAVAALTLLRNQDLPAAPPIQAPVEMFVSHAKGDLPEATEEVSEGPVREILAWLAQGPVAGWYDGKRIRSGQNFAGAIADGIRQCDVFLCVLTDRWSEREWCRRELLLAKRADKPIVVVDGLDSVVPNLFSYVGNARTLRWQRHRPATLLLAAVLEALRHSHARAVLDTRRHAGDHVRASLPEALTLRSIPSGTTRILYPDPPLPREVSDELSPVYFVEPSSGKSTAVELTTPLTQLAQWMRPPKADLIGLSISGATDVRRWSASEEHLATFADDLVTMLLLAGLRLAYGGVFDHGGARHDTINYTTRLFGLVRSYSPLTEQFGAGRIHAIENFVPWPNHLSYGDAELALYGQEAHLREGRVPPNLPWGELGGSPQTFFPRDTPVRKWAAAQGSSAMRASMNAETSARVAVAGKLEGFGGTVPGVIEEILLARGVLPDGSGNALSGVRSMAQPLFLLGCFGGATRLAIEQLLASPGRPVPAGDAALLDEARRRGAPYWSPSGATAALRQLGVGGVASALGNGLSDEENEELFFSSDVTRLVVLILTGLGRWFSSGRNP